MERIIPSHLSASLLWGSAYRIRKWFLFKIKMYKMLYWVLPGEQGAVISMKHAEYLLFRGMTLFEDVLQHNRLFFVMLAYVNICRVHSPPDIQNEKWQLYTCNCIASQTLGRAFQQYRSAKRFSERSCIGSVVLLQRPVSIHRSPDSTEKHFHHSAQKDTKANDPYLSRNLLLTLRVCRIFHPN